MSHEDTSALLRIIYTHKHCYTVQLFCMTALVASLFAEPLCNIDVFAPQTFILYYNSVPLYKQCVTKESVTVIVLVLTKEIG